VQLYKDTNKFMMNSWVREYLLFKYSDWSILIGNVDMVDSNLTN